MAVLSMMVTGQARPAAPAVRRERVVTRSLSVDGAWCEKAMRAIKAPRANMQAVVIFVFFSIRTVRTPKYC